MTVTEITLHRVKLPLAVPYHVSYRVYEDFEPIIVEARDGDGRTGWGEGHISPGYSDETVDGGWQFCREIAARMVGQDLAAAKAMASAGLGTNPVAAAALITALEMLEGSPLLEISGPARLEILTPFHATGDAAIKAETETLLDQGYRTFKVKVGTDVDRDLARVGAVQAALGGRATIRLDANRGFSAADGVRFATGLDPDGIELFEQPCGAKDWAANGEVAAASPVPVMLDESIYGTDDIDRAGDMKGVGFVKLKLKKLGSVELLRAGLERIRQLGMEPVLGDGVAADIGCWMEACVARETITNAGEFNGFLKPTVSLFTNPMTVKAGTIELAAGFVPEIDRDVLERMRLDHERFTSNRP